MKTHIKKRVGFFFTFVIFLPMLSLSTRFISIKQVSDLQCTSLHTFNDVSFTIKLNLHDGYKKNGSMAFKGDFREGNVTYIINREVEFSYYISDSVLYMENIQTRKSLADTLSDHTFNMLLMDTTKKNIHIEIQKWNNVYYLHRNFSPNTLCVESDN